MEETLDFFSSSLLPPSSPHSPPPFPPSSSHSTSSPPSYPPPSSSHPPSFPPPFLPSSLSPRPPRFFPPTSFSRDESVGLFPLHIEESINDTYLNEIEKILDGIQSPESSPIGKRSQILMIDQSLQLLKKREEGEIIIKENGIENGKQEEISMKEGMRLEEEKSMRKREEERNRLENENNEEEGCKEKEECKYNDEKKEVHLNGDADEVCKEEELKNVVAKSKNCCIF